MISQSARFVGSIPENYGRGLGPHIFNGYAQDLAQRVADLGPAAVLELAAGTGIVTRKLRDLLAADCDLLASDLNPPMLDVAKAKFKQQESVRFEHVDATDLPFDAASFDVVACQFGVMFFPDKHRSYAEVCRVLKTGGSYLLNVWDSWDNNLFAQLAHDVVTKFFPDDPPGFYKVPFGYHDPREIEASLLRAGFSKVTVEHLPLVAKIPSATDFAKGLVFGNPLHDEIVSRGGDADAVCVALAEAIETELGSQMSIQALVIQARID